MGNFSEVVYCVQRVRQNYPSTVSGFVVLAQSHFLFRLVLMRFHNYECTCAQFETGMGDHDHATIDGTWLHAWD